MKRRTFFWRITGVGGALTGLGAFLFASRTFEDHVERRILGELSFLTLDRNGVRRFIDDYTKSMSPANKQSLELYSFLGMSSSRSRKITRLINAYMLSTDFFINNMDENRTIKYVALYDPQVRPCIHPFTHLQYPEANA